MRALCLVAGNFATKYAEWRRCVSIGSCKTRVFVTTCAFTFAISAWTWNWSRQQTSNSAWNSANLERRLLKWYDVRMEMRPWVVRSVSGWHARLKRGRTSLEDDEMSGQSSMSSAPKNVETIRRLVMRIVGEPLRTLLQSLMCHVEQCRQFSREIWTRIALLQSSCPRTQREPCYNLSRASSACPGWPILHVEGHHWGWELHLRVWPRD